MPSGCVGKCPPGNEKSKPGIGSGGRKSPRFEEEIKSSKEVSRLVERVEQGDGEGSGTGGGIGSPGAIAKRSEVRLTEDSIIESEDGEKY